MKKVSVRDPFLISPFRRQRVSVEGPGRAARRCGSGDKRGRHALRTRAGLRADVTDTVRPGKNQKRLHLTHQHGALERNSQRH